MTDTAEKQPTCEERIGERLEDRLEQMRQYLLRLASDDEDEREEAYEEINESYALSIETPNHGAIQVCLSTGGPADDFFIEADEGEIYGIEYRFQDWWDGARRRLYGNDYTLAQEFFAYYLEPVLWQ